MNNYKFLRQHGFEKLETLEKRLQETIRQGWKVNSFTCAHASIVVMLEKDR